MHVTSLLSMIWYLSFSRKSKIKIYTLPVGQGTLCTVVVVLYCCVHATDFIARSIFQLVLGYDTPCEHLHLTNSDVDV